MKVTIIRGKFDYSLFLKEAIISFLLFNAIVFLLFVGVFGFTFGKLINSSVVILIFVPIINVAVNTFVNRRTTISIKEFEKMDELRNKCEDILNISGFKLVNRSNTDTVWQFSSLKKKLIHFNKGTVELRQTEDKFEITARKNLVEAFVPWLKKMRADEINGGA